MEAEVKDSILKPKVGISACLLGQKVRYNAEAKTDDWLVDELSKYVSFAPFCPEMLAGLGAPRETIRLMANPSELHAPRAVTTTSKVDLSERLRSASVGINKDVARLGLDAFILMKGSPSCGVERVKVYHRESGVPFASSAGIFARNLRESFPHLLMADSGRLRDARLREHFVLSLFSVARFQRLARNIAALQEFHKTHKFLFLGYSQRMALRLGQIASGTVPRPVNEVIDEYKVVLFDLLRKPALAKHMVNSLYHLLGFIKDKVSAKENQMLRDHFESFRTGQTSLQACLSLLKYASLGKECRYLEEQVIFEPYPTDLRLRAKGE